MTPGIKKRELVGLRSNCCNARIYEVTIREFPGSFTAGTYPEIINECASCGLSVEPAEAKVLGKGRFGKAL